MRSSEKNDSMHRRFTLTRTVRTLLSAAALAVSLFPLQAQDYGARVLERIGQVSVMNGGYKTALSTGDTIRPQQMIVTGPDGYAQFQVINDGSTFEVFANSRVVFRQALGNWKDLLNIWLGRVKVFIQHAPGVPNHNEVSSPTAVISVRGTVFDVVVKDDESTVVSVDEGVVWVRNWTAPGDGVTLQKGDTITVIKNVPLLGKQVDKSGVIQVALKATRDAMWQVLLGRRTTSSPGGVPTGTVQGDTGKGGTTTTTTPAPGSPPSSPAPSAPPPGAPPGGPPGGD